MPSVKDISASINKGNIYVTELELVLEERDRLINVLTLTPSSNDNYEVISLLQRLDKHLTYLQSDISNLLHKGEDLAKDVALFQKLVQKYDVCIEQLDRDSTIDVEEYKFIAKPMAVVSQPIKRSKSVSFKDEIEDDGGVGGGFMGATAYEPYSDNPPEHQTEHQTDHQLFAQHQQQLLEQDENLDVLQQSIRNQHHMGLTINSELDEHMIILNDLELGVDNSQYRLNSASHKLADFRRKCQENGSLVTIVVLTVILILLLVVLN